MIGQDKTRGSKVLLRGHRDQPFVGYVWEVRGDVVFVSTLEGYKKLLSGSHDLIPIGFTQTNVFEFNNFTMEGFSGWDKEANWKST